MGNKKLLDEYIATRIVEIPRDHQPTAEARAIGYVRQLLLEAGFCETLDAFDSIFEGDREPRIPRQKYRGHP